jgi:Tfp pilus assembly protein FimT
MSNRRSVRAKVYLPKRVHAGFSLIEVTMACICVLVLAAIAIPSVNSIVKNYRTSGDARIIATALGVARLRGANDFTQARLNFDLTNGTFKREVYNKTSSSWVAEGGTQYLAGGNAFGYGSISTAAGSQTTIAQPPAVSSQNVIIFNSRGVPVDSSGNATGSYAVYLNDGAGRYYAVSVYSTGKMSRWRWDSVSSAWTKF